MLSLNQAFRRRGSVERSSTSSGADFRLALKRGIDIAVSLALITLLIPIFAAIAVVVAVTSPGPVIYSQQRLGRNGQAFRFLKFRTMRKDADVILERLLQEKPALHLSWQTHQKLQDDPRITYVGRFLRRSSLDELPQLWNVLKGDMSLVGVRPCMPEQVELYGARWPAYCQFRPGITGLWQVSGRNKLSYRHRAALDSRYVRNWSLALDARILAKTLWVVLVADGAR